MESTDSEVWILVKQDNHSLSSWWILSESERQQYSRTCFFSPHMFYPSLLFWVTQKSALFVACIFSGSTTQLLRADLGFSNPFRILECNEAQCSFDFPDHQHALRLGLGSLTVMKGASIFGICDTDWYLLMAWSLNQVFCGFYRSSRTAGFYRR